VLQCVVVCCGKLKCAAVCCAEYSHPSIYVDPRMIRAEEL